MNTPQLPLGITPRPACSLDNFIAGPNAELISILRAVAHGQGPHSVLLEGPSGSGRSHLLQAVCNAVSANGRVAVYLPLRSVSDSAPPITGHLSGSHLLAIDDIDLVAGQRGWEQAIAGAFEEMRLSEGRVVVSSSLPPARMQNLLPDLASRLSWGEALRIQALSDDERLSMLTRHAQARGLEVSDEVGRYLMTRISRSPAELLRWLDRLDQESLAAQRRVTIPFVRDVLARNAVRS